MTTTPVVSVYSFPAPFKIVFKHTSAAREATENVIVSVGEGETRGWGEGCPRDYVTGETRQSAVAFLDEYASDVLTASDDVDGLRGWMDQNRTLVDGNPAAFCGLELAVLDHLARGQNRSIDSLLGLPELTGQFAYSAVLSDSDFAVYAAQVLRYRAGGLRHWKLKLSGDAARDRRKFWFFARLPGRFFARSVRVDANNLWESPLEASAYLHRLGRPLLGIEEPLTGNDVTRLLQVAEDMDTPIILDESLPPVGDLRHLPGDPSRWVLNCRVSRVGGLLRALEMVAEADRLGMGVIVGAHVGETSLLSRAALTVASAAGNRLVAQEGAFGTWLLHHDLCGQPLMFGSRGMLGATERAVLGPVGLGIGVDESLLVRSV